MIGIFGATFAFTDEIEPVMFVRGLTGFHVVVDGRREVGSHPWKVFDWTSCGLSLSPFELHR